MRKSEKKSEMIIVLVTASLILGASTEPATQPDVLSVGQTMDVLFTDPHNNEPWDLYLRANPAAVDAIRRIINDKGLMPYHRNAWEMLGFIGDASDVQRITAYLQTEFPSDLGTNELASLGGAMNCLGLLCRRDIPGAKAMMKTFLDITYWEHAPFKAPHTGIDSKYLEFVEAVDGYAFWGKDDFDNVIRDAVDKISDSNDKKIMERLTGPLAIRAIRRELLGGREAGFLAATKGHFNNDLTHPAPSPAATAPSTQKSAIMTTRPYREAGLIHIETGEAAKPIIAEAMKAFDDIKSEINAEKFDLSSLRLLEDGDPISANRVKENETLVLRRIADERTILLDKTVKAAQPNLILVERQDQLSLDATGNRITRGEVTTVSWVLRDTQEFGKKYFAGIPLIIKSVARTEDGSLKVVMKKIDRKWYWNPFGW